MPEIKAVLFDLDGTLVDTGPDMAHALNTLLREEGRDDLPYADIRPQVSHGATALMRLGFGLNPGDAGFADLRQRFLDHYARRLCVDSSIFNGMEDVLDRLERMQIPWGIVTNKPGFLTEPLLESLALLDRSACVVSGDTLAQRKPDPAPLLHACQLLQATPLHTLYIGDAERDVIAGSRAGMPTLIATFGYLGPGDRPDDWGADGLIYHPAEILGWVNGHA